MTRFVRLVGAVGSLVLLAAAPATGQAGDAGGIPRTFDVATSGAAVLGRVSVPAVFPLGADNGINVSSVRVSSGPLAIAEAAPVYTPLVTTLAGPTPVSCASFFPGEAPDVTCGGPADESSGVVAVAAASGRARTSGEQFATKGELTADAATRAVGIASAPDMASPFSVGSVATAARSGPDGNRITAGAAAALEDVEIGGVLRIDSIRSSVSGAVSAVPGGASVTHSFEVSGASVADQAVAITPDGVQAGGQNAGLGSGKETQDGLNQALAAAGVQVRLVPPDPPRASEDGQAVSVSSGGLGVTYRDSSGSTVFYLLGQSVLEMFANRIDQLNPGEVEPPLDLGGPLDPGPEMSDAGAQVAAGALAAPPAPEPGAGAPAPFRHSQPVSATPVSKVEDWGVPFAPFAALVLSVPALAVLRRLSLVRR